MNCVFPAVEFFPLFYYSYFNAGGGSCRNHSYYVAPIECFLLLELNCGLPPLVNAVATLNFNQLTNDSVGDTEIFLQQIVVKGT